MNLEEKHFHLEIFEGPLDLLLYLIRRDEIDIYNIPIQGITEQYLKYLDLMKILDLDIAGDFLAMAATLMQIKSRMLLPPEERPEEEEEEDPRWELVRQLLEYRRYKEASDSLRRLEANQEKTFARAGERAEPTSTSELPLKEVSIFELLDAFSQVLQEAEKRRPPEFEPDQFTLEDGRSRIIQAISRQNSLLFNSLFLREETVLRVIVIFLALLELIRQKMVRVCQEEHFGEIVIRRVEA